MGCEMSLYRVELRGESREVYYVDADSPEDASENWHTGQLDISECYGMEVESVEEADE
jgi:hypothetical protein